MTYNGWYAIKANQTKSYIYIYMYKEDLALNDLQWLICHKTKPNQMCIFVASPSFHSRVLGLMMPNSSSLVTAFGSKSIANGFSFWFRCVCSKDVHTLLLPVPAEPTINTEWRTSNNSCNWTTCNANKSFSNFCWQKKKKITTNDLEMYFFFFSSF